MKSFWCEIIPLTIKGFSYEHTPTEAACGGALLYISSNLQYKPRYDLQIYKSRHIETVFVEILYPKRSNLIIGCMYRHPCTSISEFNYLLSPVLHKISKEKKNVIILGDYNIDLIKTSSDVETSEFFNLISSHNILPHITLPTRVNDRSQTLIDNIFFNFNDANIISGNLCYLLFVAISDHLPQFIICPDFNKKFIPQKNNIFKRNLKNIDKLP